MRNGKLNELMPMFCSPACEHHRHRNQFRRMLLTHCHDFIDVVMMVSLNFVRHQHVNRMGLILFEISCPFLMMSSMLGLVIDARGKICCRVSFR